MLRLALVAACLGCGSTGPLESSARLPPAPAPASAAAAAPRAGPEEVPVPETAAPERLELTPVEFADLGGWEEDEVGAALPALRRSCARIARLPPERPVDRVDLAGVAGDWVALCSEAERIDPSDHPRARRFFETHFLPFAAASGGERRGRFTGYYQASMRGSRSRSARYRVPVYRRPPDLVRADLDELLGAAAGAGQSVWGRVRGGRLRPYPSRAEIEGGVLAGRGLELVWVDDPVDLFFAQIQGSGAVALASGGTIRIGFAGKNGRPYTAIGRVLVEEEELTAEGASMQGIRAWLNANPGRAAEIMQRNESYVFFAETRDGPFGSEGVVLTPGRSMAIDRAHIPRSLPIWIDTAAPIANRPGAEEPLRRLVVAQDTGGGIRGPLRGDVYFGAGAEAEEVAGRMRSRGSSTLLLPRSVAERREREGERERSGQP